MLDTGVYAFMPCLSLVYITEKSCEMLSRCQYISLFCLDENWPPFRMPSHLSK